jgi:hypothetical protein
VTTTLSLRRSEDNVKKLAVGWGIFLAGPFIFALSDWMVARLQGSAARTLGCMEPRTFLLYIALLIALVSASSALRGGWGTLLRILLILGQLWAAIILQFFVLEPIQAEVGFYAGQSCLDL